MTFPKIGTSDTPVNNRPSSYNNGSATINFTYDNSGNMTAAGATTYQWDGANRLKSVNGGTSGSYGFDGNGKRVKKTEGGASTYYVYSSVIGSAVMEVASAGVQRAYVMNGGSVVAQRNPDGNFYWLHADHLGSGRKMTNTSGNLTYRAEFDQDQHQVRQVSGACCQIRVNRQFISTTSPANGNESQVSPA